jgi:hypothetical protein
MTLAQTFSIADMIAAIAPCQAAYKAEAQRRLDSLTKPIGSLGRLEATTGRPECEISGVRRARV